MIIILQIIYKLERFNKYNQKSFAFSTRNILKLKYFKTIKINFKLNKSSQHLELSQMISIPCKTASLSDSKNCVVTYIASLLK